MKPNDQCLEAWGEFACFTRPELKVERFSYPVITPSAARGIYDAIYCKPKEFRWQITKVEILSPPKYIALRRNEVKEKISESMVTKMMKGTRSVEPIWADGDRDLTGSDEKGRTQRQTMALKDVKYRVHAEIRPWPGFERNLAGLEAQFRRRAAAGKCIYQPCFGCREFPAFFTLVDGNPPPAIISYDASDIGWMLYDVYDLSRPGDKDDSPSISLFRPSIVNGVMSVPDFADAAVHRGVKEER